MTGVILLLVLSIGLVTVIGVVNLARRAREDHEREGLYGSDLHAGHAAAGSLREQLEAVERQDELLALARLVSELDRAAFAGLPVTSCTRTGFDTWTVAFADQTTVTVRSVDHSAFQRADRLARREPLVVGRVVPLGTSLGAGAAIELVASRHRPMNVSVRP